MNQNIFLFVSQQMNVVTLLKKNFAYKTSNFRNNVFIQILDSHQLLALSLTLHINTE